MSDYYTSGEAGLPQPGATYTAPEAGGGDYFSGGASQSPYPTEPTISVSTPAPGDGTAMNPTENTE